jgi:hypothetical protein
VTHGVPHERWHAIDVKRLRKGTFTVRARNGYLVTSP